MRFRGWPVLLSVLLLAGCVGNGSSRHDSTVRHSSIGWVDHDWRICDEGVTCPRPSIKTLAFPISPVSPTALPMPPQPVVAVEEPKPGPVIVHFAFGLSRPIPADLAELEDLPARIRKDDVLRITGYTDAVGPRAGNERLARQRAAFVADWLKQHGLSNPMEIVARGQCCYVAGNESPAGRASNRRVVIEFIPQHKEVKP